MQIISGKRLISGLYKAHLQFNNKKQLDPEDAAFFPICKAFFYAWDFLELRKPPPTFQAEPKVFREKSESKKGKHLQTCNGRVQGQIRDLLVGNNFF